MYGFWILVIVFAAASVPCFAWPLFVKRKEATLRESLQYTHDRNGLRWQVRFEDSEADLNELSTTEYEKYKKRYKSFCRWRAWSFHEDAFNCVGLMCLVLVVIFLLVSLIAPAVAVKEAAYWQEFTPMVEGLLTDSSDIQSLGITDEIIEYNSWLAKARASQKQWGNWSHYHCVDLDGLKYISFN